MHGPSMTFFSAVLLHISGTGNDSLVSTCIFTVAVPSIHVFMLRYVGVLL